MITCKTGTKVLYDFGFCYRNFPNLPLATFYEYFATDHSLPQMNGTISSSLDVESLFTNVPVQDTIDIICNNVYNHSSIPPPTISQKILKQLLQICTTKTPFRNVNGDIYLQCDGVSMGNSLGPTFANYYMCHVENTVFEACPTLKPKLYVRYVDDIFLIVDSLNSLNNVKEAFEQNSVLNFTFEVENKQ